MIVNCDMVVASRTASFALPEVKIGVVALGGGLPRLVRAIGKLRASEMALTGRRLSAEEAREWGLVNRVVGEAEKDALNEAVRMAEEVAANSPDSVVVTREGLKMGWEMRVQEATERLREDWWPRIESETNMREGIQAFVEKRTPNWVDFEL